MPKRQQVYNYNNMKSLALMLFFIGGSLLVSSQTLTTTRVTDWNSLKKSGFYESYTTTQQNVPNPASAWFWGLNIAHNANSTQSGVYNFGAQILFSVNYTAQAIPSMYVRSTCISGEGQWAKVVHSLGNHSIAGKLSVREVEVKVDAGADFVFHPQYDLKSLNQVEAFIKENNHLPDIPSEYEMKEKGVNVSEFQIKLLQKIEELTLYVIKQEKINEELKAEVKELKSILNKK